MSKHGETVNESNYDAGDVYALLQICTCLQERVQRLEMKLIWKHLCSVMVCMCVCVCVERVCAGVGCVDVGKVGRGEKGGGEREIRDI